METAEDSSAMRAGLAVFHKQMEDLEDISVRLCSPGLKVPSLLIYSSISIL